MVEIAIPFNRRTVQFAQRRQHLVNHGLQRDVNHSRQTPHRYFRLTQNIKRIPTRFCPDYRVTRHKSRARESFEASMRRGGCAGSGRAQQRDPTLTLPLFVTSRPDEALAEWRAWGQVLDVPLLLAEQRGSSATATAQLDRLDVERPRPRRRRRSALKTRRPSILLKRATGKITNVTPIQHGEREIIAR